MEIDSTAIVVLVGVIGCIGGIIARDRYIASTIANGDKAVRDEMDKKIDVVHERVNKTRDEFVRRDDLDGHLSRIEGTIKSMHEEFKGTNKRIDDFMTAVVNGTHTTKR